MPTANPFASHISRAMQIINPRRTVPMCDRCSRAGVAAICEGTARVAGPAGGWAWIPPGGDEPSWGFIQCGPSDLIAVRQVDIHKLL